VRLEVITAQHARDIGLPSSTGAYIAGLVEQGDGGSPAAKAGIQAGDVVVKWNDREITGQAQLSNAVAETEIGSKARVVLFRQGQELQFDVIVGLRPPLP
jgi:serine protease Do